MGVYVNPGNSGFTRIAGSKYIDKTELIALMNDRIGGDDSLVCVSRPRRFGKSYAAKMLTAYYDCSCDSHSLFEHRAIAATKNYHKHLNEYNVIHLDITSFTSAIEKRKDSMQNVPLYIEQAIWKDLVEEGFSPHTGDNLNDFLIRCVEAPGGKPFIFIIDEWDTLIREAKTDAEAQKRYLNLLRGWFKNNNFTPKVVAAAYMTGILPIKKDGTQSAISDFKEFSMLYAGKFAEFTGFTESEVQNLCEKNQMDYEEMKSWYDGYELSGTAAIYNPYSVMSALEERTCRSFWGKTSASEALTDYINMGFDGLQETIAQLIGGAKIPVNTSRFQNDFEQFKTRDDVLTLLIHLGYLTYDAEQKTVRVPNEEVRNEFRNFLEDDAFSEHWMRLIGRSRKLLRDTIDGNNEAVAAALEEIRGEQYAPQYYNNEQSLRAVIKYAYIAAFGQYVKVEEMPSGKGLADIVLIPKPLTKLPAMIIELKWNKSSGGAIQQIKDKNYIAAVKPFVGNLLLVGINYDEKSGKHTCMIEKY